MEISVSLGFLEHSIITFKSFAELFSIYYEINTCENLEEFYTIKKAFWCSSRLQLENQYNLFESSVKLVDPKAMKEVYEKLYKEKYKIKNYEYFVDKMEHNSLYFLSNEKKASINTLEQCLKNLFLMRYFLKEQ